MTKKEYNNLDCSVNSFQLIKNESEKIWKHVDLDVCWGFQIQQGSKWKKGLSEIQLEDFQKQLGVTFPESLKNYYRTMNGLDRPGINNNGGEGEITFERTFYSYPEDISRIKSCIDEVMQDNNINDDDINSESLPLIFPFYSHRFLIIDHDEIVLSIYGNDIIFWENNLAKGIAKDVFSFHSTVNMKEVNKNSFWNKKIV